MAEWRLGRGWSSGELSDRLDGLRDLGRNFRGDYPNMIPENGWNRYSSEALLATEATGRPLPDGPFARMKTALANYHFSDPDIVVGHFEADSRLLGRRMLLEMKVGGVLRYLGGVVIGDVREETSTDSHTFGYRYDTLQGHIERGAEWFLLTKSLETGEIRFRIEAAWLPGEFPNLWSRIGFRWLGPRYQRRWHQQAHRRLYRIGLFEMGPRPAVDGTGIAHAGPVIEFERFPRSASAPEPRWEEEETIQTT